MDLFLAPTGMLSQLPWQLLLFSLLFAFLLAQVIAIIYEHTYQGMSYSRSFFHTLSLLPMLAAMLMFAVGDNLARGLGIAGIFAIVRFRTNLRDPRDMVFLFAAIAVGISCGVQGYSLAVIGTVLFGLAVLYLKYIPLGSRQYFDGLLRFHMPPNHQIGEQIDTLLKDSCKTYTLVTLREVAQGDALEYAYQIKLYESEYKDALVQTLQQFPGVAEVSLLMQETTVEM